MAYFYFLLLSIILGVICKKSWIVLLLIYVLFYIVAMYSGEGFDRGNLAYSYDFTFVQKDAEERSLAFYSIMLAFNEAGFSFFEFRVINFFIWSTIALLSIIMLTKYRTYVFACITFFPLLTFSSQMRNGLGAAFLYLSFLILLIVKKKIKYVLFVLSICFAVVIHYIFIVYLLALIACSKWEKNKIFKVSISVMISLCFLFLSGILSSLTSVLLGSYYSNYLTGETSFHVFLHFPLIIGLLLNALFTNMCDKYVYANPFYFSEKERMIVQFVSRLNIIFLSIIPMLFVSGSFYRLFQNIYIFSVISIAITSSHYVVQGKNEGGLLRLTYALFYMIVSVFYFCWQGGLIDSMRGISL